MSNTEAGERHLLKKAKAALRDEDHDRAAPVLAEIAEGGAAKVRADVANDTV